MLHLKDGLSLKSQLSIFSLDFHHILVFFLLTHSCAVAILGDDVTLRCHLQPAWDVSTRTVEWARPDLEPSFVHVWRNGPDPLIDQHPSYKGRTSLIMDKLKHGDVSLKLSEVKLSDEGKYRCFIPTLSKETTVELVVATNFILPSPSSSGAASFPVLNVSKSSSGVVLECESKGWYPEPELFWLDAEGKLLSAGTVRGPDGLYTVSSRVTVEKSHSNSFTCRVQQLSINQTRDTHIHFPGQKGFDESVTRALDHISFIQILLCLCATQRPRCTVRMKLDRQEKRRPKS
uniref:Ig-like domain-containing protein n=1 Tax=Myripristis murdjan TaxID=586833 RepID=A0A667Z2H3_9TELE